MPTPTERPDAQSIPAASAATESRHEEPPRLGITHLLVGTACAALVLGVERWFAPVLLQGAETSRYLAFHGLYALGSAAALGGVLLWGWRRYCGHAFPRHPGEYLLVVMGVLILASLLLRVVLCVVAPSEGDILADATGKALLVGWSVGLPLAGVVAFGIAAIRVQSRRWRVFFGCESVLSLHYPLVMLMMAMGLPVYFGRDLLILLYGLPHLVTGAVLGIAVWLDWRQRTGYPWTHWLGIAAKLWLAALGIVSLAIR